MSAPAEHVTATILGCGSSGGVPRVGNIWGACDPSNSKNRRRRCSLLIEGRTQGQAEPTRILIDTGCDLREQLLDAGVGRVDAVFYTHEHADHTHGIDDLRVLALNSGQKVDVYFSKAAAPRIKGAFTYCFSSPPGSPYPPILNENHVEAGETIAVEGPGGIVEISAFLQAHGDITSLGYKVGGFAYSCDISGLPEVSVPAVSGLDIWVVDALRPKPHPSHFSLGDALKWIDVLKPGTAVLTNLHVDLDYAETEAATPAHVTPAYDGLKIDITHGKVLAG